MRALAFDFDGLILDTETPELTVWQEVFRQHGVEMPEGYWVEVIGRGAEQEIERPHQLLTRLTGDYQESLEKHEERRARIRALINKEEVRPGVESLIHEGKAAGLPLGIASSSRHEWVDKYLQKLGLFDSFDAIVCADDVARAKPFPDLYVELCRRLAVAPNETVALEDSPNGLAAAKTAGLFAVVVPNSVTAELDVSHADLRIDDLSKVRLSGLKAAMISWRSPSGPRQK